MKMLSLKFPLGVFILVLLLRHCVDAEYCISAKCTCALNSVRCIQIAENDEILGQLPRDFVGLGFGQSRVVFQSDTPVVFPNIQYIGLMDSSYHFKTPVNPFPNLITLDLQSRTKYLGFPPNKIKELRIVASPNLMGKPLLKVLRNVSVEFPELQTLKLTNMGLTFEERDWNDPSIVFPHLKNLDLSGNMIESVLVLNKIAHWWKLSYISLNDNIIQHTPLSHVKQIANAEFEPDAVVRLEMSSQKMYCSCAQKEFQRWLRATEFFRDPRHIKCSFEFDAKHVEFRQSISHSPLPAGVRTAGTEFTGNCSGEHVDAETPYNLLEVAYLCDTERKSTAVNVYGFGKMKSSLVALIATSASVGLLAFFVMLCHYRKVLQGLEKLKKFLCEHPNLEMQGDGRPVRIALGRN